MSGKYFYKVVRVIEGGFGSIYNANPQEYSISKRIDCPYMFVYRPGEPMGELNEYRAANGEFALLKVRAECKPRVLLLTDLCDGIHGTMGNPLRFLLSRIVKEYTEESYAREYVFLDSLTPIGIVDMTKLKDSCEGYLAPIEGEENGQ